MCRSWINRRYRGSQRRDSGTLQQLVDQLQDSMDDASHQIDRVLDVFLSGAENGKISRPAYKSNPDIVLTMSNNAEAELAELEEIRLTYLPELLLEYHNALYWASFTLSTQYLVHCMNLAVHISDTDSLAASFARSRRMSELVEALAIASRAMVNHGAKREKYGMVGETLGLWHVEPDGEQDEEFHEFVRQARLNAARSNAM